MESWVVSFGCGAGAVMNNVAMDICISVIVGVASFQRGMGNTLPGSHRPSTPNPAQSEQGDDDEVGAVPRPKEEVESVLRHLQTPSLYGHKAARNLSLLDLPFSAPPSQALWTKGQGPTEGSMCLFPCLQGTRKAVLGVECGVCWMSSLLPRPPGVISNPHQNDVFFRGSFPACSIYPPSWIPPLPLET